MPNTANKSNGSSDTSNLLSDRKYSALIREFPLRRLSNAADLDMALRVLQRLMLQPAVTVGEAAYRDVLAMLVHEYESLHYPSSADKSPSEILQFLVHESGMTVSQLGKIVGSQPEASMLLNGTREPSKEQIVRLAGHFKVRAELFLPRPRRRKSA